MADVNITDPTVAKSLTQPARRVSVAGPEGTIIGYFTPVKPPPSENRPREAELRRGEPDRTTKGYTTNEVLEELKKRKNPPQE